jgi:hypothetical protein
MIIFNTTYLVSPAKITDWQIWVKQQHIPRMLSTGYFSLPQVSKVITEDTEEGTSFAVQFVTDSLDTMADWNEENGLSFQQELSQLFGTEVLFFSTFLEIME